MPSILTADNFDSQVDLLRKLLRNQDIISQFTVPALANTGWIYATPSGTPITNTTPVTVAAAVSGKRNYVSGLQFVNTQAPGTVVTLKSGSTVLWTGYAHATATVQPNPLSSLHHWSAGSGRPLLLSASRPEQSPTCLLKASPYSP